MAGSQLGTREMKRALKWIAGSLFALVLGVGAYAWYDTAFAARFLQYVTFANSRVQPVQIADNLWYVGGYDAASYLLTGPEGHVLIDGGYAETAPLILSNIAALGFKAKDVRLLLNTHGHFDHAAGLAALKRATGAKLFASAEEKKLLEAGGKGDFFFGDRLAYKGVKVDTVIADGDVLEFGPIRLTARVTPGHTKGCTSWSIDARIDGKPVPALLICSVSLVGKPVAGNPNYPARPGEFNASIELLAKLPCQIFLMPHGLQMGLSGKIDRRVAGDKSAFVDPAGCKAVIDKARDELSEEGV